MTERSPTTTRRRFVVGDRVKMSEFGRKQVNTRRAHERGIGVVVRLSVDGNPYVRWDGNASSKMMTAAEFLEIADVEQA